MADAQTNPPGHEEGDDLRAVYEAVLGALEDWVLLLDAEGRVLYANGSFCRWRGLGRPDCIGRRVLELLGAGLEANRPTVEALTGALAGAATGGGQGRLSGLRLTGAPGTGAPSEVIVDVRVTPLERGDGLVLMVVDDITEHWRAQEDVIRERRKLNDMVQATGAGLSLMDLDRRVIWANRVFVGWFGDPAGRSCFQIFRCADRPCEVCRTGEALASGSSVLENWSTYTAGGMRRHFQNTVTPIRNERGEVFQFLVLTQDVTATQNRIEQLNLLRRLGETMSGTLELDRLLNMVLTCVTAGHALGFNRAFLFLRDRATNTLNARQAVGPTSREEAFRIWGELAARQRDMESVFADAGNLPPAEHQPLFGLIRGLSCPVDPAHAGEVLVRAVLEKKVQVVTDAGSDPRVTPEFRSRMGARSFVAVPLVAMSEVVGVVIADNLYSGRPISEEDTDVLGMFANQAGLAIENARAYAELQDKMERLRTAQAQLVHSENLATIGRMAAHVAHEIRNPLTTIGGFARAILKHIDRPERVRDSAGVIGEEVARLEKILSTVMDFTRPAKPDVQPCAVADLVRRVAHEQAEEAARHRVVLDVDIDEGLPAVPLDAEKIKQVIINIVRNAVQAMPGGGALRLALARAGDLINISVTDTGEGMSAKVLQKIFNPFFTTKQDGTGLGLALSRKIVEDHGGSLTAVSDPGKGSTFTIALPVTRPSEVLTEEDMEETREFPGEGAPGPSEAPVGGPGGAPPPGG